MVDIDKLYENKHFEIDDVHHAAALLTGTMNVQPEGKVIYLARMLAVLREYYYEIGRQMAETVD